MRRSNWTPSIVPEVTFMTSISRLDDLGRIGWVWREADYEATDFETVVTDLLEGQYKNPGGIFAFNTAEGWSRCATCRPDYRTSLIDMTRSIAHSSRCRCAWCEEIMKVRDAFDRWWEWASKPPDSLLTIPAELHQAVTALSPEDQRDRAKVNRAAAEIDKDT
jgi:hypothetical protein